MPNVALFSPFVCRMWRGHIRLGELVTEDSCRDEIQSFLAHGQKLPVLGRLLKDAADEGRYEIELIYGARRLFVAQHLNVQLAVEIREISDDAAFVEMDIENRLRLDLSPYERGTAYKEWIRTGYFKSQKELASALGMSDAHVSRLLRFAELPSVVIRCFQDLASIKESWAVMLAERCKDSVVKQKMVSVARTIEKSEMKPTDKLKQLLDCENPGRNARTACTDVIVRSDDGVALFRISYRANNVHIVVPRARARTQTIDSLAEVLKQLIQGNSNVKTVNVLEEKAELDVTAIDAAKSAPKSDASRSLSLHAATVLAERQNGAQPLSAVAARRSIAQRADGSFERATSGR